MVSIQVVGVIALIGTTALTLHGCGGCDIDYKELEKAVPGAGSQYDGMIDKCTLSVSGIPGKCCDSLKKGEACGEDDMKKATSVAITMTGKSSSPVKKMAASIDVDPSKIGGMSSTMMMNNVKEALSTGLQTPAGILNFVQRGIANSTAEMANKNKAVETNVASVQVV